jgi:hypothetical protein
MAGVFLVNFVSWNSHRVMAGLGLLACLLWIAVVLLPIL